MTVLEFVSSLSTMNLSVCWAFTTGHPIFRPEECSKAKVKENCRYTIARTTIETVFRTIISVNQLSLYEAVVEMCDEYRACQARTQRPVLAVQSDPLFEPASLLMTTPTPLTEVLAQEDLLQKYKERVERLSRQNRVIKTCIDAGFLTTVGVGQYFMTKDTEEFSQFTDSVACREYTLPREMKNHLTRKVGSEGIPKLDPYWKLQPVAYKVNMEWKSELCL